MNISAAETLLTKIQDTIFMGLPLDNRSSLDYVQESLMSILTMAGGGDGQSLFSIYTLLFYVSGLLEDNDTVSQTLKLFCSQGATLHELPSNLKLLAIFASPQLTKKFLIPVTSSEVKVWQDYLQWEKHKNSKKLLDTWDILIQDRLSSQASDWEEKALIYARSLTLYHLNSQV